MNFVEIYYKLIGALSKNSGYMKEFHVAISANQCWNIYNFRKGLLQRLISAGVKVTIIAPEDECAIQLRQLGCSVIHLSLAAQGTNPFTDLKLVADYAKVLKRIKPDLIINYTIKPVIYGSLGAAIARVPSLAITTGLGYTFINENPVARIARRLYKFALRFPKQVWFLNADDRDIFVQFGLVDRSRTFILDGEGIDTAYFSPSSRSPSVQFKFLLIARMLRDKGIGEFVKAAELVKQRYPSTVFQLLGGIAENPTSISMEQITSWRDAGIVDYLGSVNDVRAYISSADCVVLPSYREGVPRTLLEAAAMGKPLIATDVPGCREVIVDQKSGYLCKARDAEDLANKMLQMIEISQEQRMAMGMASRTYVEERFNENVIVQKYFEFLTFKCNFGSSIMPSLSSDTAIEMPIAETSYS